MSCIWIPLMTMGYFIDSLDICFGTQLADSRGDIGIIHTKGLMHVLVFVSLVVVLEHSLRFFSLD